MFRRWAHRAHLANDAAKEIEEQILRIGNQKKSDAL